MNSANAVETHARAKNEAKVRIDELGAALKRCRQERGLSLRDLSELIGVSYNTLSRMERSVHRPDAENITRVAEWLEVPVARIVRTGQPGVEPVVYYPNESTPEIVQAHLNRDPTLTTDGKAALGELFRIAYKRFASIDSKKR